MNYILPANENPEMKLKLRPYPGLVSRAETVIILANMITKLEVFVALLKLKAQSLRH